MKNKFLYVCALSCFAISCTRAEKNTSFVSIQLPEAPLSSKSTNQIYSDTGDYYDEGSDWSATVPTGLDASGAAPINCYGIMVSGPEDFMRENACGRKAPGSTSNDIQFVEGEEYNFKLGFWSAATPAGGNLEIEIPSGNDRIFRLIGFHASDAASCVNLKGGSNEIHANLSKPYIISKSSKINLAPGSTVTVPMEMSFDANLWFEECKGPAFNEGGNGGDSNKQIIATKLAVTKPIFDDTALLNASCDPLDIIPVDDLGRAGKFSSIISSFDIRLKINSTILPTGAATLGSYATKTACISGAGSGASSTFNVTNGSQSYRRWVYHSDTPGFQRYLFAAVENIVTTDGTTPSIVVSNAKEVAIRPPGDGTFQIIGPRRGVRGKKYKYKVVPRKYNGSIFGHNTDTTPPPPTIDVSIPAGTNASQVYAADCTSANVPLQVSLSQPFPEFCVEFNNDLGITENLIVSVNTGSFNTNTPGSIIGGLAKIGTGSGSDDYIHHIKLNGPKSISLAPGCYGPFSLSLENEAGTEIQHTGAVALTFNGVNSDNTNTDFHLEPNCSDTALSYSTTSGFTFHIPTGESRNTFYLKVISTLSLGSRTLYIKDPNSSLQTELTLSVE